MPTLRERETAIYDEMWGVDAYAKISPGADALPIFLDMTQTQMRTTVLDAGCGTGKGSLALQAAGFTVKACDLTRAGLVPEAQSIPFTEACLWEDLRHLGFSDWVYCTDVLEHIPTAYTMLVVSRLLDVARRGVFLTIATQPDVHGVWVGKRLHQTIESFTWWRDQLGTLGDLQEARDCLFFGAYLVTPRVEAVKC